MMNRRGLLLAAITAALFTAAGSDAHAAIGDFTFTTTVVPGVVNNPNGSLATVTLVPLNSVLLNASGDGTDIRFGNITVSSTSPTNQNIGSIGYVFTLTITDVTSGQTGQLTINGTLTGTAQSTQANIANLYTPPLSRSVTIGGLVYTATVGGPGSYTAPSPGPNGAGSFGAQVTTAIPEPASVTLLGMGSVGLVGLYFRRKLRA